MMGPVFEGLSKNQMTQGVSRAWIRLIQPGLQWRLVGRMAALLSVATVLTGLVVLGWVMMTERRLGGELFLVTSVFGGDPVKVRLTSLVWPALALALGLNLAVAVVLLLRYSLRIAGPAYRLERALRQLGSGDHTLRVHLRPGDELQNLAGAVNVLAESLEMSSVGDEQPAHLADQLAEAPPPRPPATSQS